MTNPNSLKAIEANPESELEKNETGKIETTPPDPFDLDALRLPQDFEEDSGVKTLLKIVPVRKPNRQEWIWVNADPAYRDNFLFLELKEERELYLVTPQIARELPGEVSRRTVYVCQNASRVTFLWPVKLPAPGERLDTWSMSAHDAAEEAMRERIRVSPNMSLGAYEITTSTVQPVGSEPKWPGISLKELITIAFRGGKLITSLDHPVVRLLRGL